MSTMLAIVPPKKQTPECTLNILPAKISYDGHVNASTQYWQPEDSPDGSKNAYFRGRKLKGKSVKIPDGYSGAVLLTTDKTIGSTQITAPPPPPGYDVENDAEDEEMETDNAKTLEQVATFDEITLWGHDAAPSNTEDGYAKAIEEWVAFADTMHKCESVDKTS